MDKVAHRPNAPSQLVIVDIYGIVNYYFVHEFNNQVYMLALKMVNGPTQSYMVLDWWS